MTTKRRKAIRSSGWRTDMFIGFPDGLLVIFFTTQILHTRNMSVQTFYNLHYGFLVVGAIIMFIATYRANKGHDDDGLLSTDERNKLEKLALGDDTIHTIADEMEKDEVKWQQQIQQEQVQLADYSFWHAVRSAFFTMLFFVVGGFVPLFAYLADENFVGASRESICISLVALIVFAYAKAKMANLRALPIMTRNIFMGLLVLLASYCLSVAF
ncbi:VIT family protein [Chitinophaga skermanii]|uniref:VIT family protein n=1 Tax=Chitinophaga skermanii TaxID=331697 RepID=A0A327QYE4_9BACT|nr:VIT1/CCC1 transporter family protein [Chitinophaga skermanii]RAJ06677.1 VIT family protein [Chitinophaga skermanii]